MNKLYITITIDTENSQSAVIDGKWAKDTMIGYCRGKNWGIRYIIKLFKQYNVVATWYLSIFEKYLFNEKLMADICELLMECKQDIQLHTHPIWLMDPIEKKRVNMYQYSLEEQVYIIEKGIQDLYKLTGKKPIAHRAGGYGVNRDTFIAMKECGIKVDSSIFYKNTNCKVQASGIKNKIADFMGITEIPVSIYRRQFKYPFSKWKDYNCLNKIDINWVESDEVIKIFKDEMKHGGGYLNLFMHSGSFYKFYDGHGLNTIEDVANKNDIVVQRFHKVMQYINKTPDIKIVTVPELYEKYTKGELEKRNYVPKINKIKIG